MHLTNKWTTLSLLALTTSLVVSCVQSDSKPTQSSIGNTQLKIATAEDISSFDPRLIRDLASMTPMRLLYEGLTRVDNQGKVQPALAEKIDVSNDNKTYTFTLRDAKWNDGTPVTANDFVETWKTMLKSDFPAPNAYQLYLIKGAKQVKEGQISFEDIGIKAPSPKTLVIELEQPAPYFLEILSCPFAFPVHQTLRNQITKQNPTAQTFVGNGPFTLANYAARNEIVLAKNPHYWDNASVNLDTVILQILDENTAIQLFKNGSIDWAGSPLSTLPQDAVTPLKQQGLLHIAPGGGTHWFRFNTRLSPFSNVKMRRAFGLALNRKDIVEHVTQGNQIPAIGIVPPAMGITHQNYFPDNDADQAKKLLADALKELNITKNELPKITLKYVANDRNHKIAQAVQQQWKTVLGLNIDLESTESHVYYERMRQGQYQITLGSWYADIQDPINFLDIFKSKDNPTNQTFWENPAYADLLNQSSLENDPAKRLALMGKAEALLIAEMPVAPIFHSAYNYLKTPEVEDVYFSPSGFLDMKAAKMAPAKH